MVLIRALVSVSLLAVFYPASVSGQTIRLDQDTSSYWYGQVLLENLTSQQRSLIGTPAVSQKYWSEILQIYTGNKAPKETQLQVLGDYTFDGQVLRFKPRFPFELSQPYYAIFNTESKVEATFQASSDHEENIPLVTAIYPSGNKLPANLIRFYLHFSVPMRRDDPYSKVFIIDSDNNTVENAIYPADPALWSKDGMRLTVLLDPGRIKQGLAAHEHWGLALNEGDHYRLMIHHDLQSRTGTSISKDILFPFSVVKEDKDSPQLSAWTIHSPLSGKLDPLMVEFDEPLDRAQCFRWIKVVNERGKTIDGSFDMNGHESKGLFIPRLPWQTGKYMLKVYNLLEDLAGNSIRKPFEVEVDYPITIPDPGWDSLEFVIG